MVDHLVERKVPDEWKPVKEGEWADFACAEGQFRTTGYTEYMLLSFLDQEEQRIEQNYKDRIAFVRNMRIRIKEGINDNQP